MSGVIGAPSVAVNTGVAGVRGALGAARSDTAASILSAAGTGAANTTDAISALATRAAPVVAPVVAAAQTAATKAQEVAAPAVEAVQQFADRPNQKLREASVAAAERAVALSDGNLTIQAISDVVTNLIDTTVAKMSDAEVLNASQVITDLQGEVKGYTPELKNELVTILSSPDMALIRKRMARIDLNTTQTAETEVTPETTQQTLQVARMNPVNVNPDHVNKILEQRDRTDLTDEDITILKAAAEIASAVNNHQSEQVQISSDKSVALSKKPAYKGRKAPAVTKIEETSRSIQVAGFKDARGNKLRSVNDFAADISEGAQSSDGTIVNEEGVSIPVSAIVNQFRMFATHMSNKVEALNKSAAEANANGAGTPQMFRSLVGGVKMVAAGAAGGAKSVTIHLDRPLSVAFAQGVRNDAVVAVEVYNTLARTYPELFPSGEMAIPTLVIDTTKNKTPDTTAAETTEKTPSQESKPQAEPEVSTTEKGVAEVVEQPETKIEVQQSTPEEDAIIRKLNEDLKLLKRSGEIVVMR